MLSVEVAVTSRMGESGLQPVRKSPVNSENKEGNAELKEQSECSENTPRLSENRCGHEKAGPKATAN